ncbi:MAG: CorA family divalent cation transporter [Rhodospirillaceae bacterium]
MAVFSVPECGLEPGLRFACVLNGRGGAVHKSWQEVQAWQPEDGVLWIHLERDDPATERWIMEASGIDPVIGEALLMEDSRPRVEGVDDGLLIVLRGISQISAGQESHLGGSVDLVPVHLWIDGHRVISLRDKDHQLGALRDIRNANALGKGPGRPGELLVLIADKLVKDLEPVLDAMDEEVDLLEDEVLTTAASESRIKISDLRRRAIHLRRYLAPQRDALNRLQREDCSWLTERDKVRLREVIDKVLRYIEYLDSIRDRAIILHEDLSSLLNERIARTSNRLTGLAALLLPPSLVAGLLGMNVGGLPGTQEPYGFYIALFFMALLSVAVVWILRRLHWM